MIVVIDCDLGNTGSVVNMIKKISGDTFTSLSPNDFIRTDKLILPEVEQFVYSLQIYSKPNHTNKWRN